MRKRYDLKHAPVVYVKVRDLHTEGLQHTQAKRYVAEVHMDYGTHAGYRIAGMMGKPVATRNEALHVGQKWSRTMHCMGDVLEACKWFDQQDAR